MGQVSVPIGEKKMLFWETNDTWLPRNLSDKCPQIQSKILNGICKVNFECPPPIMLPQNYPQLNLPLALWFSICISMIKYISDILLLPVDIYQGFPKYVDGWGSGFNIVSSSHYLPVRLNYYCPISFWRIWGAAKLSNLPLARRWIQPGTG